jgi:hypothetical protein
MLVRLFLLISITVCTFSVDVILSVGATTQIVSNPANITITLSLANTSSQIKFTLPNQYSVKTIGCLNQNQPANCSLSNTTTQVTISFSGSFSGQQQFQFQVVNPFYESDFELFSYNNNTLIGGGSLIL